MQLPDTLHPAFIPPHQRAVYVQWVNAFPSDPKFDYWKGCIAWHDRNRPQPVDTPARIEYTPQGSYAKVFRATTQKHCPKCGELFTVPLAASWRRSVCAKCEEVDRECCECGEVNRVKRYATEFICWQCETVNEVRLRGDVTIFSSASRKKLMGVLNKTRKEIIPSFATLTHPDSFFPFRNSKKHVIGVRRMFAMRFYRAFPRASFFWRRERADRKSGLHIGVRFPHYHLLVYGVGCNHFSKWLEENWPEIACPEGRNDIDFKKCTKVHSRRRGKAVKLVKSRNGVMKYASKTLALPMSIELGKTTQTDSDDLGRWWGIHKGEQVGEDIDGKPIFAFDAYVLAPSKVEEVPDDTSRNILEAFKLSVMSGMRLALEKYKERGDAKRYELLADKIRVMTDAFYQSLIAFINGDEVEKMIGIAVA